MRYRAVVFDMDGTVLDTLSDLDAAINAAMRHFGYPEHGLDDTRRFVGNGSRRLVELSLPDGAPDEEIDRVLDWYLPYYNAHSAVKTAPYPGVTELMRALKASGIKLAIVSNKPDRTVKALAEKYFGGLTETAVGENERAGVRRKPHPDTALAAAELMGERPEDCLCVGDSEVDVMTARNAGMDCAAVLWGFRSRLELEAAGAKLLFDSPEALGAFILGD